MAEHGSSHPSCVPSENLGLPWLRAYQGSLEAKWKPISLTYVDYPTDDLAGKFLAWSSLAPIFIVIALGTLIIFRRELHTIAFFIGILSNEALNQLLKYSLKKPRPCRSINHLEHVHHTVYGMPSSHAQFMSFFAVYMSFFAYFRLKQSASENWLNNLRQHFVALSALGSAAIVSFSRIYLYYHTVEQVGAGMLVGCLTGSVWFYLVHVILTPMFPDIVNTKFAEFFLVRDSTNIPDILWFEYTSSRVEARQRQRRSTQKSQ